MSTYTFTRKKLSQESPTLTAHRPSFPTCLFHPRRVHLLCHLDSPSAASLPYLGLQEQAGPEFSGLYGSYRDFSQEFSSPSAHSLTWRSRSQANKPHAVQCCAVTTIHRKHRQMLPTTVQQSQDDLTVMIFRAGFTHRLAQFSPNNPGILPLESNTGNSQVQECVSD
jgi:hypothetical protein